MAVKFFFRMRAERRERICAGKGANFEAAAGAPEKRKGWSACWPLPAAALAACAALGLAGCARSAAPPASPAPRAASHRPAAPAGSLTARGMVESAQRRSVYSTLGAKIERVYVEAGDKVSRGQALGALDTADIVTEANIARAALGMAEINLEAAKHHHGIIASLHSSQAVPHNDLRQSEFAVRLALAASQQARAVYDGIRSVIERSVIRSPIDGTVTAVIAREGAIGMGLMFIVEDTGSIRVMTSFREYDIARLESGKEVAITSYATGSAVYTGIISRINPAASAFAPIVEFEAEVLVTSPNSSLRIGTSARLSIAY